MPIETVSLPSGIGHVRSGQWRAVCDCCGGTVTRNFNTEKRQLAEKNYSQQGYRTIKGRLHCPACVDRFHEQRKKANQMTTPVSDPKQVANIVRVSRTLDENFDTKASRYIDGWSDERVSRETGVAPALVAEIRATMGMVIGDPEVIALRSELQAVSEMLRNISDRLDRVDAKKGR